MKTKKEVIGEIARLNTRVCKDTKLSLEDKAQSTSELAVAKYLFEKVTPVSYSLSRLHRLTLAQTNQQLIWCAYKSLQYNDSASNIVEDIKELLADSYKAVAKLSE